MSKGLYSASKWAGAVLTLLLLGGWVSRSSVRLHKVEEEAAKVTGIEMDVKIIKLTLKLLAPEKYKQAEELAR